MCVCVCVYARAHTHYICFPSVVWDVWVKQIIQKARNCQNVFNHLHKTESEIAQERAQQLEMIQSAIMDDYNAAMLGKIETVLVDGYDENMGQFYGRTYADSPEIDSRVWIASQEALVEGAFVKVCIDGVVDGELSGYILED